jgi:hypothetical protein
MKQAINVVPISKERGMSLLLLAIAAALGSAVLAPSARAQANPGRYRCVSIEVGGQTSHCQSPSLTLNSDGSYQIWGESGTYEVVQDRWLVLSHSKRRGLGYFLTSKQIVFEYKVGNRKARVTFELVLDNSARGLIDG